MSVVAFIDTRGSKVPKASAEALTYARRIADAEGGDVVAVTFGDAQGLGALGAHGASKVIVARHVKHVDGQQLTRLVAAVAESSGAKTVVCVHDATGKAVAPRVAARLKAGHVPGALDIPENGQVKRNVFSGKAQAWVLTTSERRVLSLMPNSVAASSDGGEAAVEEFTGDLGAAGVTVKEVKQAGEGIPLPEADIVVSAGRGMKGPEHWGPVEELARTLGAATACSRPVADMDWRPHHEHVGQTGVAIRPNCYIAIGISGAIQHLAGVNQSKVIAVINKDPEAPFFKAADYGIVGDAFEVLPKLIEAAKKLKAEQ
ncbi:MAG: electron transfer flavoprotein subunit alpha/FixB family protein [Flavobacteriales bacterium]|nr:electron transfer flavoprotein subunit alpha/FixB family protein [Flavobacteriales bacterium]MCB0795554.1 electron transfer flavoprotein subunit alpha/FixB family protein [Flavobacteriales bacterium]